jgi:hypothetical protein
MNHVLILFLSYLILAFCEFSGLSSMQAGDTISAVASASFMDKIHAAAVLANGLIVDMAGVDFALKRLIDIHMPIGGTFLDIIPNIRSFLTILCELWPNSFIRRKIITLQHTRTVSDVIISPAIFLTGLPVVFNPLTCTTKQLAQAMGLFGVIPKIIPAAA